MIPGAVFAGLMTTDGVVPHFLDAQRGLSQSRQRGDEPRDGRAVVYPPLLESAARY